MNPDFPPPLPDPNSSSLAYLNHQPPGTQPHYRPAGADNPIKLGNRPAPDRVLPNPQQDLMDIDMGDDNDSPASDASPDNVPGRGLKRARPDTSETDVLEHSEPVFKQRRTEQPELAREEPIAASILLSPEALSAELIKATVDGNLGKLQSLIQQADTLNEIQIFQFQKNAPILAAVNGHLKVVKWLVENGCNIHQKTEDKNNVLTLAARHGHLEVVQWFVENGCNIHHVNDENNNALTLAARYRHFEVVQWLFENGCNIHQVNDKNENAQTFAANHGNLEFIQWLFKNGCNIHQVNDENDNALTLAANNGHLEVVQWLFKNGCNIHQVNDENDNALTLAANNGHLEIVQWLFENGCNIHQVNDENDNALTLAANRGHLKVVQWLADQGCNINQVDSYDRTALFHAMNWRHIDIACELIKRRANVHIGFPPESDGSLFEALDTGNPALINLLIPLHDVSRRSADGSTPLMIAAEENLIEIAVPLIKATLKFPNAPHLVTEASAVVTGPLFKELLYKPYIILDWVPVYSYLQSDGEPIIGSAFINQRVQQQYDELFRQTSLGSAGVMTPMQIKAAKTGVLAELSAWKLQHPDESLFTEKLPPALLPVREKVITFINEDIEVLATQALQWEEDHLIPVVENLYEGCLSHALSAHPAIDITNELTAKGLYHPIAQKIAAAWTSAWATVSEEAARMLRPSAATCIEDWEHEDLTDLDPLSGEMIISPKTLARSTQRFVDLPVGSTLLQAFRAALRRELDSVGGRILRAEGANLSEQSKALYADLMGRQLHLIAQFWRAQS